MSTNEEYNNNVIQQAKIILNVYYRELDIAIQKNQILTVDLLFKKIIELTKELNQLELMVIESAQAENPIKGGLNDMAKAPAKKEAKKAPAKVAKKGKK